MFKSCRLYEHTAGIPAESAITATSRGEIYFSMITANSVITVDVIDSETATAKAGLKVEVDAIAALLKMTQRSFSS